MNTHKIFNLVMAFVFSFSLLGMPTTALAQEAAYGSINTDLAADSVQGNGWPLGNVVALIVHDPATPPSSDITMTDISHVSSWNSSVIVTEYDLSGKIDLKPGFLLTMTDGNATQTLTLVDLQATLVDRAADTVLGIAPAGMQVDVSINDAHRTTKADDDGHWMVDFSKAGAQTNEQIIFDILGDTTGWVSTHNEGDVNSTGTEWIARLPYIQVNIDDYQVWANDWPSGALLTMTISGPNVNYSAQLPAPKRFGCTLCTQSVFYYPTTYQLQAGDIITITDGTLTKSYAVSPLQVTNVDLQADTISGIATPYSRVAVWDGSGAVCCTGRSVTADESGHWFADFSIPGDRPRDVVDDLTLASCGQASENSSVGYEKYTGDETWVDWSVPNPKFDVWLHDSHVRGNDWPVNSSVTLSIDDPGTLQFPDYTQTQSTGPTDWDPSGHSIDFDLQNQFQLKSGQVITLTSGSYIKTHTITSLTVTNVNPATDTVTGTADPGTYVNVTSKYDDNTFRRALADSNGNWSVDFSQPGSESNEQVVWDITPGNELHIGQTDDDGDSTMYYWRVLQPVIWAHPNDSGEAWIDARDWSFGETIHLTIDNDTDPSNGVLYADSGVVGPANWNPSVGIKEFHLGNFDLKPGYIVTLTGQTTTKVLVITDINVTDINPDLNTVSGTAVAGSAVQAWLHEVHTCGPEIFADENGFWTADFSPCELKPGVGGGVGQKDADEDSTVYFWQVPNPWFYVWLNPRDGTLWDIHGYDWPLNTPVTMTLDNPNTPVSPDYTRVAYMEVPPWGGPKQLVFDINGMTAHPGDLVTMTAGNITLTHTITSLRLTTIDAASNVVSGTAEPGSEVSIGIEGYNGWRNVTVDANGIWMADFSQPGSQGEAPFDIQPGMKLHIEQKNGGGTTAYGVNVPNPNFNVRANNDQVEAFQWAMGDTLTLTVDNPNTQTSPDYTTTKTVTGTAPWDSSQTYVFFDLSGIYDIQVGDHVSVSNGAITKTTVVTNLEITNVDVNADIVYGNAEPNQTVNVWTCWQNDPCVNRDETADSNGHWVTNFAIPGEKDWEQGTMDLRPGSWIDSSVSDEDGDSTMFGWNVPNGSLHAVPAHPEVHGHEWPQSDTVTLTIDNDNNPNNGVLYTQTKNADDNPWCGYPCFDLSGIFTLQVGQYVTMSDNSVSKTVLVSRLHVTEISQANDTISGVADPGSTVQVNIWSQNGIARTVQADQNGDWSVDFSMPGSGEKEVVTNIVPGDNGRAIQLNPDGSDDGTLEYWNIPNPTFNAALNANNVHGSEWPLGASVTLTIHDPDYGDYTDTKTVTPASWDPNQTFIQFDLDPAHTLKPGQFITMADGATIKTLTVTYLEVTATDIAEDTVSGKATAGSEVIVAAKDDNTGQYAERWVTTDANGNWTADFTNPGSNPNDQGTFDLVPGSQGAAHQRDEDGDQTIWYWNVPVNQPPVADAGPDQTALEGATVTLDASASSDPEGGTLTYAWDFNNDGQYDDATGVTVNTTFADNGTYIVGLQVTDEGGLSNTDSATITVNNVAPMITSIIAPVAPIQVANNVLVNATFHDPGTDTFTAAWDWGDGSTTSGAVSGQTVSGSHFYFTPGIYTLKLTVADDDGGTGTAAYQYIVIYDPNGGFTTGGGWYVDAASGDKATFGFNTKYQKNSSIPTGNTEFKVGTLNFKSTTYDWLVVSGTKAQFKGTGTVNKSGGYAFIVTVIDERSDLIRIKIWNSSTGAVVYDTLPGAADDANPVMPIQGGSIVIHNK